jgi:hypothetical protein
MGLKRRCSICGFRASARATTRFAGSKKQLKVLFRAIWYLVTEHRSLSILGMQRAAGLGSYHTASRWFQNIDAELDRAESALLRDHIEIAAAPVVVRSGGKSSWRNLLIVASAELGRDLLTPRRLDLLNADTTTLTARDIAPFVEPETVVFTRATDCVDYDLTPFENRLLKRKGQLLSIPGLSRWLRARRDPLLPAERLLFDCRKWLRYRCSRDVTRRTLEFRIKLFHYGYEFSNAWSPGALFRSLVKPTL